MGQMLVIEGTWDEIKRHEAEFADHHLRVIVDSDRPTGQDSTPQQRLDAWRRFVSDFSVPGVVIDDSREAMYGNDGDRG